MVPTLHALLVLIACKDVEPSQAQELLAALELARADPTAALEHCARLGDAGGRGLCVTAIGEVSPDETAASCAALADPVWRDECQFSRAEGYMDRADRARAAEACEAAGRFLPRCVIHVAEDASAQGFAGGASDAPSVLALQEVMLVQYGRTNTGAAWGDALHFYFGTAPRVDPSLCDALTELGAHVPECSTIASQVLAERLPRVIADDPGVIRQALCGAEARSNPDVPWPDSTENIRFGWATDPRLRPGLAAAAEQVCGHMGR